MPRTAPRTAFTTLATSLVTMAVLLAPAPAQAHPLEVTDAQARAALECSGNLRSSPLPPLLLLHATAYTPETDWGWTWARELRLRGWAHCQLRLPHAAMQDIQASAEYVVWAIRWMRTQARRDISLIGHSQGGMIGRWAFKYWPDTRGMVEDYVGISASNHGTEAFAALCTAPEGCAGAVWQQTPDSAFLAALNAGTETWTGVDYTEITTEYDEVVVPSTSGWLTPGPNVANISLQDVCPGSVVDHFRMPTDNAAWTIGLDALTNTGPARVSRISPLACLPPYMPGVDPLTAPVDIASTTIAVATAFATADRLPREPALRCYATDAC